MTSVKSLTRSIVVMLLASKVDEFFTHTSETLTSRRRFRMVEVSFFGSSYTTQMVPFISNTKFPAYEIWIATLSAPSSSYERCFIELSVAHPVDSERRGDEVDVYHSSVPTSKRR